MNIWKENSIAAKEERWKALYAMEDLPRPLWYVPANPMFALPGQYLKDQKSVTDLFSNKEVQLRESVKFLKSYAPIQKLVIRDDYIPTLQPQLGVGVFASAFGCEVDFPPDQFPVSRPVIGMGDAAEKVFSLRPPDIRAGLLGDVLDFIDYFEKHNPGNLPVSITDVQGPIDTAFLVWDSTSFFMAMYDNPKAVHHLMQMITDLMIKFITEFKKRVKRFQPVHFPYLYVPDSKGIAISEDVLAMMSPELYEEFSLPYVNQLSEAFGGIFLHSCGNWEHQIPVLAKIHNLRSLNFGVTETRFESVWEKFSGKVAIVPHCSTESIVYNFKNTSEWLQHVLTRKTHNRGLALVVSPFSGDMHENKRREALHTKGKDSMLDALFTIRKIKKMIKKHS